jgi:hypothetical protein
MGLVGDVDFRLLVAELLGGPQLVLEIDDVVAIALVAADDSQRLKLSPASSLDQAA